jgi:hypothetical protein
LRWAGVEAELVMNWGATIWSAGAHLLQTDHVGRSRASQSNICGSGADAVTFEPTMRMARVYDIGVRRIGGMRGYKQNSSSSP